MAMKALGLFLFINLRIYKRPVGRPVFLDVLLLYLGSYCWLGSNIPGVHLAWPLY